MRQRILTHGCARYADERGQSPPQLAWFTRAHVAIRAPRNETYGSWRLHGPHTIQHPVPGVPCANGICELGMMMLRPVHDDPGSRRFGAMWWVTMTVAISATVAAITTTVALLADHRDFPGEGSAEVGFARDMSVHHAQAVQMAEIIRDTTSNDAIAFLATDIALTQQAQIGRMHGWLSIWGVPATGLQPPMAWMGMPVDGIMPGMASGEELARLRDLDGARADGLFLRLMIDHHEAGLDMAEAVLDQTNHSEVEELASAMVQAQQVEITAMTDLLNRRSGGANS